MKQRIGYWLLSKLIKQTFIWRKNNFFLEFHIRFNLKSFIKSLIFKNFFSGWIALCLHFTFTAHHHRVTVSVLNTICGYNSNDSYLILGCYHVYLDVGSNVGIQIRKLYEPSKYVGATIHPVFDKYFHRNIQSLNSSLPYICAVGFEPNPHHESKLKGNCTIWRWHFKYLNDILSFFKNK